MQYAGRGPATPVRDQPEGFDITAKTYQSWSDCSACGFQGLMSFACRIDENYDDDDAIGVMMDLTCPACEERDAVLVVIEAYREMVSLAAPREG